MNALNTLCIHFLPLILPTSLKALFLLLLWDWPGLISPQKEVHQWSPAHAQCRRTQASSGEAGLASSEAEVYSHPLRQRLAERTDKEKQDYFSRNRRAWENPGRILSYHSDVFMFGLTNKKKRSVFHSKCLMSPQRFDASSCLCAGIKRQLCC